tara:strand:+ start:1269 stop:1520 length:252 start_codon:yes stop_codon:yes gene_type:complete
LRSLTFDGDNVEGLDDGKDLVEVEVAVILGGREADLLDDLDRSQHPLLLMERPHVVIMLRDEIVEDVDAHVVADFTQLEEGEE